MDKILIKDTYFAPFYTIDNTEVTIDDAEITLDLTNSLEESFRLEIVPRKYSFQLIVNIREPLSNRIETLETIADIKNNLLNIDLSGFTPIENATYDVEVKDQSGSIIWIGACKYSTKDIQNYQLNNSNQNNLKL